MRLPTPVVEDYLMKRVLSVLILALILAVSVATPASAAPMSFLRLSERGERVANQ